MTLSTTPGPIFARGCYVALVENGIPKFSVSPVRHPTKDAALAEAVRLAKQHPGKLFQVFNTSVLPVGSASRPGFTVRPVYAYQQPKPKTFTGKELQETAAAGVYQFADQRGTIRIVVLANGPVRVCLYCYADGTVSPMHDRNWNTTEFVLTDENAQQILRGVR